mgnify:CR=1 FL=1
MCPSQTSKSSESDQVFVYDKTNSIKQCKMKLIKSVCEDTIVVNLRTLRATFRAVGSKRFVTTDFNPLIGIRMKNESHKLGTYN